MQRIQIVLDDAGNPIGAVTSQRWDEDGATHWPLDVGPFDTLDDVYEAAKNRLTFQMALW